MDITDRMRTQVMRKILADLDDPSLGHSSDGGVDLSSNDMITLCSQYTDGQGHRWDVTTVVEVRVKREPAQESVHVHQHFCLSSGRYLDYCRESCTACAGPEGMRPCDGTGRAPERDLAAGGSYGV
jgi:hypothetical protein